MGNGSEQSSVSKLVTTVRNIFSGGHQSSSSSQTQSRHQCFHLHVPPPSGYVMKRPLGPSQSFGVLTLQKHHRDKPRYCHQQNNSATESTKRHRSFRVLDCEQVWEEKKRPKSQKIIRRNTLASVPIRPTIDKPFGEGAEDHIYEEIKEEYIDSDENSFLSLISAERRRNLQYYGSTGWDFVPEM